MVLKEARRRSFASSVFSLNDQTHMTQVWKRARKTSEYTHDPILVPVLSVNGEIVTYGTEVANTIPETFAQVSIRT